MTEAQNKNAALIEATQDARDRERWALEAWENFMKRGSEARATAHTERDALWAAYDKAAREAAELECQARAALTDRQRRAILKV